MVNKILNICITVTNLFKQNHLQVGVAAVLAVTESVSDFSRVLDLAER